MKKEELVILAKLIRKIVSEEVQLSEKRILSSVRKTITEQYKAIKDVEDIGLSRATTVFNQTKKTPPQPKPNIKNRVHRGEVEKHSPIFSKDPMINEMLSSVTSEDLMEMEGEGDYGIHEEINTPELKAVSDAVNRDYSSLMKTINQKYGN